MKALAVVLACLAAGCVSLSFDRVRGFEPIADDILVDLRDAHADLGECLRRLGAPNLVHELPDGGMALAWGWLDARGWGIHVSVSVRGVDVGGDYDGERRHLEGAVLFFDASARLVKVERGLLHDFLQAPSRHPPATVEGG